jgi:uncharacterized protein YkwD
MMKYQGFKNMLMSLIIIFAATNISIFQAEAAAFKDVSSQHWASSSIAWGVDRHIVKGYVDGTFRPDQVVTEAEFLVMLLRAYPDIQLPSMGSDSAWYEASYALAEQYRWPILRELIAVQFDRGRVALLIAATQGQSLSQQESIQYLLDHQLSKGKTAPTVQGYDAEAKLTRAEALTFIRNMHTQQITLKKAPEAASEVTIKGLEIGGTEAELIAAWGEPNRKDASIYGFTWYIYNSHYKDYVQAGILDGKVVALYTHADNWQTKSGLGIGSALADVTEAYGTPLEHILKGNIRYGLNKEAGEELVFLKDGAYMTIFIDKHEDHKVTGIQLIAKSVEEAFRRDQVKGSDALRTAFERQSFDLVNVSRVRYGLPSLGWNDQAAEMARKHSAHMAEERYFSHTTPAGITLGDRLEDNEILYSNAAENIAAGQSNAIFAHAGWMNSLGHRKNILGNQTLLGVGVYFGGDYGTYYTQNFLTLQ